MNDRFENYDGGYDDDEFNEDFAAIPAEMMNRWKQIEFEIQEEKLNQLMLRHAIELAQSSFWWRFLPLRRKINIVTKLYHTLGNILNSDPNAIYSA